MSQLTCSVNSCGNNCSGLCSLTSINVGGQNATSSSETVCASYRSGGSATDSAASQSASPATNVSCKACNCKHNDQCNCTAGTVTIDNCSCGSGAGCRTFQE